MDNSTGFGSIYQLNVIYRLGMALSNLWTTVDKWSNCINMNLLPNKAHEKNIPMAKLRRLMINVQNKTNLQEVLS